MPRNPRYNDNDGNKAEGTPESDNGGASSKLTSWRLEQIEKWIEELRKRSHADSQVAQTLMLRIVAIEVRVLIYGAVAGAIGMAVMRWILK